MSTVHKQMDQGETVVEPVKSQNPDPEHTPAELQIQVNKLERIHKIALETLAVIRDEELLRVQLMKGGFWKRLWHLLRYGQGLYTPSKILTHVEAGAKAMEESVPMHNYQSVVQRVWFNDSTKFIEVLFKEPVEHMRFNRRDAIRLGQLLLKQANKLARRV